MRVRLAVTEDAQLLAELRWLSRSEREQAAQSCEAFTPRFRSWFAEAVRSGRWCVAVASSGSGLVGCMYLHVVDKVPVPGCSVQAWGYVTHAYVREGERNRGVGSELLQLLVACAHERNLELLQVWPSTESVRFYERAGFLSPESQRTTLPGDEPSFILPLDQLQEAKPDET